MSPLARSVVAAAALVVSADAAAAQGAYRTELFGGVGVSRHDAIFQQGGTTANFHLGLGVRPFSSTRRLAHRLGLEVAIDTEAEGIYAIPFFSNVVTYVGDQRRTTYLGSVLYHGREGRMQPYVGFGVGGSTVTSRDFRSAAALAGGVKVFSARRLILRPEFRLSFDGRSNATVRGSMAVGFHW